MENNQVVSKIEDNEMDSFFQSNTKAELVGQIYANRLIRLEEEFLQTEQGKRIKEFEKLGIGLKLEEVIEKYIEIAGIPLDEAGNVILEKQSLNEVYQENLGIIYKQLGYDISELDAKQVAAVMDRVDHVSQVNELEKITSSAIIEPKIEEKVFIKSRDIKLNDLGRIRDSLDVDKSTSRMKTSDFAKVLAATMDPKEETQKFVEKYERDTKYTFLENAADVDLISALAAYKFILSQGGVINEEIEEEFNKAELEHYQKSKYFSEVCDENGNFSVKKAMEFYEIFKKERNENDLVTKIGEFIKKDELTEEDQKRLAIVLLRLTRSEDKITQMSGINVAKNFGIDIVDKDGKLDRKKIEQYCRSVGYKKANLEALMDAEEFNDKTAFDILSRIDAAIEREELDSPTTADQVNEYKENQKKKEVRLCSKKEAAIFNVLDSQNALNIKHNYYSNPKNAKQLILLFCTFRQEEIAANKGIDKSDHNFTWMAVNTGTDPTANSAIIFKYILQNRQYFEEYLNENDVFEPSKVMELLEDQKMGISRTANQIIMYEQIKKRTDKIQEEEVKFKTQIKDIDKKIAKAKENGVVTSTVLLDEIYKSVKGIPVDLLTTDTLEYLKRADEKRFNDVFDVDKVTQMVGQNSWMSIYFSAAKTFVKGVYAVPRAMFDKNVRQKYMTNIKKKSQETNTKKTDPEEKVEGEMNSTSNKKKGFFSRLFGKDKTKLLPKGESAHKEQVESTNQASSQEAFDMNQKYDIDHSAFTKSTSEATVITTGQQSKDDIEESTR